MTTSELRGTNKSPKNPHLVGLPSTSQTRRGLCCRIGGGRLAGAFYNDVWSSADGQNWTLTTAAAPWSARSGPRLVSFRGGLLLIAGERGFTPQQQLRDVWSSADAGRSWSLVTATPEFSPRSGHSVVVLGDGTGPAASLLLLAGWPQLHDAWSSVR